MIHREDVPALKKVLARFSRYLVSQQDTEQDKIRAKANIYRHLHNFQNSIDQVMRQMERELLEAGVEEYFEDFKEKVVATSIKLDPELAEELDVGTVTKFVAVDNWDKKDVSKAMKQKQSRDEGAKRFEKKRT